MDGSSIGKRLASVFYVIGKVNLLVDAEKIKKRGKELEASWSLLERNVGDVELVAVDGLYYVKEKINWLRKQGKHILIKTKEKNLEVIKDAEEVFENRSSLKDVEYQEGVWIREDGEKFSYRLWAAGEFVTDGIDDPLKVAKVELINLKNGAQEVFYVITTWGELSGLEMKELAHLRWRVENNAFKKANEHFALKHAFIKNEHGWEALMLILFIGFNLFEILRMELIEEGIIKATRKTTYQSIAQLIEKSLIIVHYLCLGKAFSIDSS